MIDVHSHFLPAIDDGSRSLEESRALLEESFRQGVDTMIATPHFYGHREAIGSFLKRREKALTRVLEARGNWGETPEIRFGAEVYYYAGMSMDHNLPKLCINGSRLILIEMPFEQWDSQVYSEIRSIVEEMKLIVIIAHIERYYRFQRDKTYWENVFDLPVIPQVNGGGFLKLTRRSMVLNFVKEFPAILLGSDCHRIDTRPPNLQEAREVIHKKLGGNRLEEIDMLGRKLLS